FDRTGGQEHPRADLWIAQAIAGQPGDVGLLRGQGGGCLEAALPYPLARSGQLPARSLGESFHAYRDELVVGRAQLFSGVGASALVPQPLAVEQVRAGEFRAQPRAAQPVDRLTIEVLGRGAGGQEGTRTGLDSESPVAGDDAVALLDALKCASGQFRRTGLG